MFFFFFNCFFAEDEKTKYSGNGFKNEIVFSLIRGNTKGVYGIVRGEGQAVQKNKEIG